MCLFCLVSIMNGAPRLDASQHIPFQYAPPKRVERQACDRCHGHKVRCTRAPSGRSCVRCQRAGATCVYSSPVKRAAATKGEGTASSYTSASNGNNVRDPLHTSPPASQDRARRRTASFTTHSSIPDEADRQTQPMAYLHHPQHLSQQHQHPPGPWLNTGLLTPLAGDFETAFPTFVAGFPPATAAQQLPRGLGPGSDTAPRSHCGSRSSNTSLMDSILAEDHLNQTHLRPEQPFSFSSFPHEWQAPFPHELDFLNEPHAAAAPLSPDMSATTSSDKPSAPEQFTQNGQRPNLQSADESIQNLFHLHLTLHRRGRSSSTGSSTAGSSMSPPPSSSTNTNTTPETAATHLVESSQSLIAIIHTLSLHHHENQLEIDGPIALSLVACYIQLLLLYDNCASTHSSSSSGRGSDQGGGGGGNGTGVSLAPPSLPALEAGLKVQLAMHLLTRLSQGLRGLLAVCRDVFPASAAASLSSSAPASGSGFASGHGNSVPRPQHRGQDPAASATRGPPLPDNMGLQLSGPVEVLLRGLGGYEAALGGKLNEVVAGLMRRDYF
ncbi:Zn(II)2Cys6 transcription factor domain-containing protein [Aspergillus foveolatus]|uniref:Zn(II)2Cys6 transcription factor domain-containing protein n=1 Tax=Aspergillus foveolatus TaxID=210207 RepID=UPI003CCE136B